MIFCNKKTCPDNVNGQRCEKINIVLFNGICRYERDRMLRWLDKKIAECELAIRDDSGNAEYWIVRKKTLEEVRGGWMNEKLIYEQALKKWGLETQLWILFEEMGELQQVVAKLSRGVDHDIFLELRGQLIDEIVDVEIMLNQLKVIARIPDEAIEHVKEKKIERLRRRLEAIE